VLGVGETKSPTNAGLKGIGVSKVWVLAYPTKFI